MPWHPFIVHFPIALWSTGTICLVVALFCSKDMLNRLAWLLLSLAALSTLPAALSGNAQWTVFSEHASDHLIQHRNLGILIPWLTGSIVLFRAHLHFSRTKIRVAPWVWILACVMCSLLILYSSHLGGKSVYLDGFGVSGIEALNH